MAVYLITIAMIEEVSYSFGCLFDNLAKLSLNKAK